MCACYPTFTLTLVAYHHQRESRRGRITDNYSLVLTRLCSGTCAVLIHLRYYAFRCSCHRQTGPRDRRGRRDHHLHPRQRRRSHRDCSRRRTTGRGPDCQESLRASEPARSSGAFQPEKDGCTGIRSLTTKRTCSKRRDRRMGCRDHDGGGGGGSWRQGWPDKQPAA